MDLLRLKQLAGIPLNESAGSDAAKEKQRDTNKKWRDEARSASTQGSRWSPTDLPGYVERLKKLNVEEGLRSTDINGKPVDLESLEVGGVNTRDYPDFSDAYFEYGMFADGSEMSEDELNQLTDEYRDLLHQMVHDSLYEGTEDAMVEGPDAIKSKLPKVLSPDEINAILDLPVDIAKEKAIGLINKSSTKQEKKDYLIRQAQNALSSRAIVKLLYDMLLAGEGHGVTGSRYARRFNRE